jgi:hypothetical protein
VTGRHRTGAPHRAARHDSVVRRGTGDPRSIGGHHGPSDRHAGNVLRRTGGPGIHHGSRPVATGPPGTGARPRAGDRNSRPETRPARLNSGWADPDRAALDTDDQWRRCGRRDPDACRGAECRRVAVGHPGPNGPPRRARTSDVRDIHRRRRHVGNRRPGRLGPDCRAPAGPARDRAEPAHPERRVRLSP